MSKRKTKTEYKRGEPLYTEEVFYSQCLEVYGHLEKEEVQDSFEFFCHEEGYFPEDYVIEKFEHEYRRFVPLNPEMRDALGFKVMCHPAEPNRRGSFPVTEIFFELKKKIKDKTKVRIP